MVASFKNLNNYTFDLIISYQDIYPREIDVCVNELHRIILCRLFAWQKEEHWRLKTGHGQVRFSIFIQQIIKHHLIRKQISIRKCLYCKCLYCDLLHSKLNMLRKERIFKDEK